MMCRYFVRALRGEFHVVQSNTSHLQSRFQEIEGTIFDIQDYSIHDGPGIRTIVFLKGCPLNCLWCSNPESQSPRAELGILQKRCVGCGRCIEVCPEQAISVTLEEIIRLDRRACIGCGRCVAACENGARKLFGTTMSVSRVIGEVTHSAPFYTRSGGGVTFSGGEPLLQFQFLQALLASCRKQYLHTAIETCGYITDHKKLSQIAAVNDLFLYDIKCIDEECHRRFSGVSNRVILKNVVFLSELGKDLIIRVPVIPDFNDNIEVIRAIATFVIKLDSLREVNLLPFHSFGKSKYEMLDRDFPYDSTPTPETGQVERFRNLFIKMGISCSIG